MIDVKKPTVTIEHEIKRDGKDWARLIVAKKKAGYTVSYYSLKIAKEVLTKLGELKE